MKKLSFLHLGDVHYPESRDRLRHVDRADDAFATKLIEYSAPHRLKNSVDAAVSIAEKMDIKAVLLSGDLTTRGDQDGYHACVQYLQKSFSRTNIWSEKLVHVVPGNHDLNRRVQLNHRFAHLTRAWHQAGLPVLRPLSVRSTTVHNDEPSVVIYSLNSWYGCGDRRRIPDGIQEQLRNALDKFVQEEEWDKAFSLIGEDLDTPAFNENHLSQVAEAISGLGPDSAAIVLAHHGLLPQTFPRYALYTEVINSGLARCRLAELGAPVLYLHGHIHDDPVEVVLDPQSPGAGLICISAPVLEDGFNLLHLVYAESGILLGLELEPHRTARHGGVARDTVVKVPLWSKDSILRSGDEVDRKILHQLTLDFQRFLSLDRLLREHGSPLEQDELANRLAQLEWLQLADIDSRASHPKHWVVRRVGPT